MTLHRDNRRVAQREKNLEVGSLIADATSKNQAEYLRARAALPAERAETGGSGDAR